MTILIDIQKNYHSRRFCYDFAFITIAIIIKKNIFDPDPDAFKKFRSERIRNIVLNLEGKGLKGILVNALRVGSGPQSRDYIFNIYMLDTVYYSFAL